MESNNSIQGGPVIAPPQVKRYDPVSRDNHGEMSYGHMKVDESGDYVRYDDYDNLYRIILEHCNT